MGWYPHCIVNPFRQSLPSDSTTPQQDKSSANARSWIRKYLPGPGNPLLPRERPSPPSNHETNPFSDPGYEDQFPCTSCGGWWNNWITHFCKIRLFYINFNLFCYVEKQSGLYLILWFKIFACSFYFSAKDFFVVSCMWSLKLSLLSNVTPSSFFVVFFSIGTSLI